MKNLAGVSNADEYIREELRNLNVKKRKSRRNLIKNSRE